MTIYKRPDELVLGQSAYDHEVTAFPNIRRGWGVAFDQTGGIPPMEWFNALGKRTDEAIRYLTQRGIAEWSATEDYPQGAVVYYAEKLWFADRANQGITPSNHSHWQVAAFTEQQVKQLIPVTSVNGKTGAVELTAADVGALTSVETNNAINNSIKVSSVNGQQGAVILSAADVVGGASRLYQGDLNELTDTGFFRGSALKNAPTLDWVYIEVNAHNSNYLTQRLTDFNSTVPLIWIRNLVNGVWHAWYQLPTTENLPSYVILYPNGTAEQPASIKVNQRIVAQNPFRGQAVLCYVELLLNGSWGNPQWIYSAAGYGVIASHLNGAVDQIIVQSGSYAIMTACSHSGNPFGRPDVIYEAPFRVKVWRI